MNVTLDYCISGAAFDIQVVATNVGQEVSPIGIGWHPYFSVPGGRRDAARLHVPARKRLLVNDYDEVLPTGAIAAVKGTDYDFSIAGGKPLNSIYLDDCFVDLRRNSEGHVVCCLIDSCTGYGLRVIARSPEVTAVQVYAPPQRAFVAIEPQFNWANPYGDEWPDDASTGMVVLKPAESVSYCVRLELFTSGS
jgi:galactose mutarotase-like enzyme